MRNLIILLLLSFTLTACSSDSATSGAPATSNNDDTPTGFAGSDETTINALDMVTTETPNATVFDSDTYPTLTSVADATPITLPALAVSLNDATAYIRENAGAAWDINDKSKLQINQQITLTRIEGATANITFNATADSATINYGDTGYTATGTVDRNTLFGLASDYVAHIIWNDDETSLADSEKTGSSNTIHGMAIAGILTEDTPLNALIGATTFTGAGAGVYGSLDGYEDVTFDVTTRVNFTDDIITIIADNTKAGTKELNNLDFTVTDIDYMDINAINHSFTDLDGMAGSLDARFYGTDANEFGGTFAFSSATNYYYGAFYGGQRGILRPIVDLNDLTEFADSGRNTKTITLPIASLVQITKNSGDNFVSRDIFSDGVATLTYDGSGNFTADSFAIYFDDYKYDVTAGTVASADSITGTTVTANIGAAPSALNLDRVAFGFTANYMASIDWQVANSYGFGITGFETDTPIAAGKTVFTGEGQGRYSNAADDINTQFTINATVDFASYMVTLESTDTCRIGTCQPLTDLDFKGVLHYVAGDNTLFGTDIETKGNDNDFIALDGTELNGTADAKFYGGNSEELGGTFDFINATSKVGYVGWFGGKRGYVIEDAMPVPTPDAPNFSANVTNFTTGLSEEVVTGLPVATMVLITTDSTAETITNEVIVGGAINYDYTGDDFNANSFNLYLADKIYTVTDGTDGELNMVSSAVNLDGTAVAGASLNLYRDSSFGFTANHMARIDLTVGDTKGYGIAGFETASTGSLLVAGAAGTTTFTGEGAGYYSDDATPTLVDFNINATVNFGMRMVDLETDTTCKTGTACSGNDSFKHLDFMASAQYDAGTNGLNFIDIKTKGTDDNYTTTDGTELSGNAIAKFYGSETDELGGTFSFSNSSAGYVGYFGGKRYEINVPADATPTDSPLAENTFGLTSFNTFSGGNEPRRNINLVRITDNSNNKAITLDTVTGAIVGFGYASSGFANSPNASTGTLQLKFADKDYNSAGTVGTPNTLTANSVDGNANVNNFILNRGSAVDGDIFGFTGDYMALISWYEDDLAGYTSYGYGITGYETAATNALFADGATAAANFAGKGQGRYQDATGGVNTFFNITATANFSTRTVSLESTGTCTGTNCADLRNDLNFMGNLTYDAGTNELEIAIATENDVLTGTADAKFYGPTIDELGGTFKLNNNFAGYAGYFGGELGWFISTTVKPLTTITDTMSNTITVPTTFANYSDGFENTALDAENIATGTTKIIALPMSNAVQTTRDATAEAITNHHYTGSVAEITYDEDGDIIGIATYFDDKKYDGEKTSNDGDERLYASSIDTSNTDVVTSLSADRRDSVNAFSFDAKYMASIRWTHNSVTRGFATTGFETTNIPTDAGAVTFTGQSHGRHSDANTTYQLRYFLATATVDFSNPTAGIAFSTSNTCTSDEIDNCGGFDQYYHLNMQGTLYYTTNEITGDVKTAGTDLNFDTVDNDGTELSGTANARFYGPAAEELGGTFSVISDSESFTGFFGAEKP